MDPTQMDSNFGAVGEFNGLPDLPDDLLQDCYDGQQNNCPDLQTPVHLPGLENASLEALLAHSTPTPQHTLSSSISAMSSVANYSSATVGAMASAGLNVNTVKNPLSNSLASSSDTVTLNKSATATSLHMVSAGDRIPELNYTMATSLAGSSMMNTMNMKPPMGPNPGQLVGNLPGMPGMGLQQPYYDQIINGPGFPPGMGQVCGKSPTTMDHASALSIGQNNMIGNSQVPQMSGHQNVSHVMNVPQNQTQLGKQNNCPDLQTPVHLPGLENASLEALLAHSTPTPQHTLSSSISAMSSVANHSSATVGAMASAGLNVNTVENPLSNSLASSSDTVTFNKYATAAPHMVGAGDRHPKLNYTMATSLAGSPMMNTMNMKPPMGPNPGQLMGNLPGMPGMGLQQPYYDQMINGPGFPPGMEWVCGKSPPMGPNPGQLMGNLPGVPGMGLQQPYYDQMINGPGFPPGMGWVCGKSPTTMGNAWALTIGQNNVIGNSQMPQMPGYQNVSHVMNVPQNQTQLGKPPSPLSCGTGQRQPAADSDKGKLVQMHLKLLLHARKCQQREQTYGEQSCGVPHCGTMKNVLNHLITCTKSKSCEVTHCASSRQIITHWHICSRSYCPLCSPLKLVSDRTKMGPAMPPNSAVPSRPNQYAHVTNVTDATRRRAYESFGLKPQSVSTMVQGAGPSQPAIGGQITTPSNNSQIPQVAPTPAASPSASPAVKKKKPPQR